MSLLRDTDLVKFAHKFAAGLMKILAKKTDIPKKLPADGGNADTVGGHTVGKDVPSNAKFTDTVYTHPSGAGYQHIPAGGTSGKVLKCDGNGNPVWETDNDTVYTHPSTPGNKHIPSGGASGQVLKWKAAGEAQWATDNNTTYSDMKGASTSAAGTHGLAPAPAAGAANRYLRSDGTWQVPPDNNTTYGEATQSAPGLMPADDKLKIDFTNVVYGTCATAAATAAKVITISGNTKWALKTGAIVVVKFANTNTAQNPTFNVNGTGAKKVWYNTALITTGSLGYAGTANRPMLFVYDGTQYVFMGWSVDSNTTYGNFVKSGENAKAGLVPSPGTTAGTSKYLREDGTWSVPPDQTSVSGNAGTADKWANARNVNGMSIQGDADRVNYGTCSTAAATAAKTAACTGFKLITGAEITVKFTVTNTAANPTLNVNNTGAKPIYYRGAAISAGYLAANRTYTFRYNGTQYDLVGDIDTNTTYSNFVKSGTGAKAGLVPSPGTTAGTKKVLFEDATWDQVTPDDLTLPVALLRPDAAHTIPDKADLNTYITPGVYCVASSTNAATMTNPPTTGRGFMLFVICPYASTSSKYVLQIAITWYGETYARNKSDTDVWSSWAQRKYTDTTYTDAKQSAHGLMPADDKLKIDFTNVVYGTCATAAATAAKVITVSGNTKWALKTGAIVMVKFSNTNTAQNPTFNVNGTGAKKVWYNTALITTGSLGYAGTANRPMMFVYDGTQYVFMGWSMDANTTYSNMTAATASAAGKAGLVPAPAAGKQNAFLRGDATWVDMIEVTDAEIDSIIAGTFK